MTRNGGNSRLRKHWRAGGPMAGYDRLPPELRRWLSGAVLPWSVRSARRAWALALARAGGNAEAALARLTEIEARQIGRDARAVWGDGHPACRAAEARRFPGAQTSTSTWPSGFEQQARI